MRKIVLAVCAVALLVTGPLAAQDLPLIRVASPPFDAGAQPYYADAMGFFKQAGINVEITKLDNGAAVTAAVASGAVDIGQSNLVSLATAHERGVPIVVIAGCTLFDAKLHQNAIVVAPNSPLRDARDLAGKTIAVNGLRNITQIGAQAWLDRSGVSSTGVRFIEMPFGVMPDAVAAGRVDAAVMAQPELASALTRKTVRVLGYPYEAIGKTFLLSGWFANANWVKAHPDLVKRFTAAMQTSGTWANKNPALSAKILEHVSGVPLIPGVPRVIYATDLDPSAIQPLIEVAAKYGALKATFPATDLIAR